MLDTWSFLWGLEKLDEQQVPKHTALPRMTSFYLLYDGNNDNIVCSSQITGIN